MIDKARVNTTKETSSSPMSARVSFSGNTRLLVYLEDITKVKVGGRHKRYNVRGVRVPGANTAKSVPIVAACEKEENGLHRNQQEPEIRVTQDDSDFDEVDLTGKALFGFKTPKRQKRSVRQTPAESVRTPSTASNATSKRGKAETTTPARAANKGDAGEENGSGSAVQKRKARKVQATTPYRLASRMDPTIDSDNSIDSEDSDESSVDDNVADVDRSNHTLPSMTDEFFKAQNAKAVTSDHTLARLREDGILDQSSLSDILSSRPNQYKKGVKQLLKEHQAMYRSWMLQLCLGFNLLLYGYGSKKNLLEEFRKSFCSPYHCLVINGFFPSLTLRNILLGLVEDCLGLTTTHLSDTDAVIAQVQEYLNRKDEALYIFVHNIDGPMVRSSTVQYALSSLAALENVHLIASVDHINAPLMWNQSTVTKYRWLWYDATTFEPYLEETSYENSLMTQQAGTLALRSMCNVYKSLTPNAKNIFLLMAKYHMDNCSNPAYIGIPFQMLYRKCRESFLVNSDQTLRTQLTEFRDHKLVRSRKGVDGAEHLFLPTEVANLNDFMEQVENMDS